MRTLIFLSAFFFLLAPAALAATIPAGGTCTPRDTCESGYTCGSSGRCVIASGTNTGQQLINPLSAGTSLESFLTKILEIVIRIGTIVVILMLVYVGFMFVTARGEPGKLTTARQALLWTVVGALILLGAQAIAIGIKSTVGAITG